MAIKFTDEQIELLYNNGFTDEDIQYTIDEDRKNGLKDSEIQRNILKTIGQYKGLDLTPSGLVDKAVNTINAGLETPVRMIKDKQNISDAFKSGYENSANIREQLKSLNPVMSKVADFGTDIVGYNGLGLLKAADNANKLIRTGVAAGNAAIQGGVPTALEYAKRGENAAEGAGVGTGVALALQGILPPVIKGSAAGIQKVTNSDFVKNKLPKAIEFLTSVPAEFTERAIQKELDGNTIFQGKFNNKDLNKAYKNVGERAIAGMRNASSKANADIKAALNSLPEGSINSPRLINEIIKDVEGFSNGGRTNPALNQKGNDIMHFLEELNNGQNNTVDFHNIKSDIQNLLRNQYGKESGEGINALKGMGAKIREALNNISPEYAQANANREALHEINRTLDNMNPKTIASKLRNTETDAAIRKGVDEAAEELDNIVAPEYKFLDEVKDLRAREALEKWLPGQGQGAGSEQGAGNIGRGVAAVIANNLMNSFGGLGRTAQTAVTLGSLGAFSPKWTGKGTIKNIGKLNNIAQNAKNIEQDAYNAALQKMNVLPALSKIIANIKAQ